MEKIRIYEDRKIERHKQNDKKKVDYYNEKQYKMKKG